MRQTESKEMFFTNLPDRIVGGLKPAKGMGEGWMPFEYELDIGTGRGLIIGHSAKAEELVLDLGLPGRYRLYFAHNPLIRVWLDGDPGYCQIPGHARGISEYAMPAADLTGRRLHIAPVRGAFENSHLTLFYIRARPCADEPPYRRNLVATNDGHGIFFRGRVDSARDLYKHVAPFADSDFFRLIWGVYGGALLTLRPDSPFRDIDSLLDPASWLRQGDRHYGMSLSHLRDMGVDPLAVVRQATRDYGLELHYYVRLAAFYGPFPIMGRTTNFMRSHPQLRCRDEHGQFFNMMSYAWPQVQDVMLAYLTELLDYEPEGLCLAFNRGLPLTCCEEPVLETFRQRFGRTPVLPEEVNTPEMLSVRMELLGGFVQRVRQLVESRGKALSCIAPRDFEHSAMLGFDLEPLLRQGLFDSVHIGAGHGDNHALVHDLTALQELRKLGTPIYAGGSGSKAHGAAWVTGGDMAERARRMANILDAGLDGGFFWDAEWLAENEFDYNWEALRRFGDRTTLDRIIHGQWPEKVSRQTRRIHDLVAGRYNPWHAY